MICEYAIEIEAMIDWAKNSRDKRDIKKYFGLGTPRIMSDFPRGKKRRKIFKQIHSNFQNSSIQRKFEELYNHLNEKTIKRQKINYDGNLTWLENAELENSKYKFKAVISRKNPRQKAFVLSNNKFTDWINNDKNNYWYVENPEIIKRTTKGFSAVKPLLSLCRKVQFIDPYLYLPETKYKNQFEDFFTILTKSRRRSIGQIQEVQLHIKKTKSDYKNPIKKVFQEFIPNDLTVSIFQWEQKDGGPRFHNRYILTDIGGVNLPHGLATGDDGEIDDIYLLTRKQYEEHWQQINASPPAFEKAAEPIIINGTA